MYTGALGDASVGLTSGQVSTLLASLDQTVNASGDPVARQAIRTWVTMIANDPVGALGLPVVGGSSTASPANAWLSLQCWAGDQNVLNQYRQVSGDLASSGCGCEEPRGCRLYAVTAIKQMKVLLPLLATGLPPVIPTTTTDTTDMTHMTTTTTTTDTPPTTTTTSPGSSVVLPPPAASGATPLLLGIAALGAVLLLGRS